MKYPAIDEMRPSDEAPLQQMGHECARKAGKRMCITFHKIDPDTRWVNCRSTHTSRRAKGNYGRRPDKKV